MKHWTGKMVARLTELCRGTTLSYAEMATTMNRELRCRLTKNACLGKAGRLGLAGRPQAPANGSRKLGALFRPKTKPAKLRHQPAAAASNVETEVSGCLWPSGDAPPYTSCDGPKLKGLSYCLRHARIAYPNLGRPRAAPKPPHRQNYLGWR